MRGGEQILQKDLEKHRQPQWGDVPAAVLQEDRLRPRDGMGTTKVTQRVPGGVWPLVWVGLCPPRKIL